MKQEVVKRRLEAIGRLRLLAATNEEMSRIVNHRVDEKNGLSKIGGQSAFLKRATYDALCRWANKRASHDFDDFMQQYEKASAFFIEERMAYLFGHNCEALCSALLDALFLNEEQRPAMTDPLRTIYNKVYGNDRTRYAANPILVVLMALGLLPANFSRGRGRGEQIEDDFRRLIRFLKKHIGQNTMYEQLPVLTALEDWLTDADRKCCARFWLFDNMADVLDNYYHMVNADQLQTLNSEVRRRSLCPDLEGWMWQEREGNVWWHWEQLSNAYFLHRTTLDHEARRLLHERFEVLIYDSGETIMAHVVHPSAMLSLVGQKPVGRNQTELFEMTWDKDDAPQTLTFSSILGFHWFQVGTLRRTAVSTGDFFRKYEGYPPVEQHPEWLYDYHTGIAAITPEAIYIRSADDPAPYYRVPLTLNEALRQVRIDDPAGLMVFTQSGRRFVAFTDPNFYLEVTDEACCERNGVERVTHIG